ncbi:MAG: extensin family protein [Pseudomonadota bacterium]
MRTLALALSVLAASVAAAPETSLRPVARAVSAPEIAPLKRPVSRPGTNERRAAAVPIPALEQIVAVAALPSFASLRPILRPRRIEQKAMARRDARRKGQVCGDPDLQGDVVGYVPGRLSACGIDEAVRVRSVSGVALSQSALMNCRTAKALKRWTEKAAIPALKRKGGGLQSFRVAAHYACRTRNNQPGGRISEHGKGNAIDISGFTLRDGTQLTVLRDWNSGNRRALRDMHRKACGPFGTVLGPNADRFHRDHFHFDTARHRGGPYCR